jgi:uncharacterized membrane protein
MLTLAIAAATFIFLHTGISGSPLRGLLVARVGERAFPALFSVATLASLVFLVRGYKAAFYTSNQFFWNPPVAQHLAAPIMLVALLLAVPGLTTRSPTAVAQGSLLARDPQPRGIQRVTRHPFLIGVMIWACFHIFANGDAASLLLFATFFLVALYGVFSIDRKRKAALGALWQAYAAQTSILPFAAIARGRTRFVFREIGFWRVLLTLAVFALLVAVHPLLFHAYPMPGMDD